MPQLIGTRRALLKGNAAAAIPGDPLPATVASAVFFGNSYVQGVDASDNAHRWSTLVAAAMSAAELNKGIGGTVFQNSNDSSGSPRASNGYDRFISDLGGISKRAMVFIAYGFNDARYTDAPATMNVANYQTQFDAMVPKLFGLGYYPNEIVIATPYYITDAGLATGTTGFTGQTRDGFEAFVTAAKTVALKYGTYFIDIYGYERDHGGASLIGPDDIHPQDVGHAAIAVGMRTARRLPVTLTYSGYYAFDTVTDADGTLLTAHIGEWMGSWFAVGTITNAAKIQSNRIYSLDTATLYRVAHTALTPNYIVEADLTAVDASVADSVGITARMDSAGNNMYFFRYSRSSNNVALFKVVSGTTTQLGSNVGLTGFTSGTHHLGLKVQGTTITAYLDGTQVIQVTDSGVAAANFPGIRMACVQSSTTGTQISNFKATPV